MTRLALFAAVAVGLAGCQIDVDDADAAPTPTAVASADAEVVDAAPVLGPDAPLLTVYKSPTCGCCSKWVDHMQASGFRVEAVDRTDMHVVKDSLGVPSDLASCHTGVVESADGLARYVVEGHVPAEQVRRLLAERPNARGLTVPGMPIGSPGMEMGDRRDPYDVLIVDADGEAVVYEHIEGNTAP